MSMGQIDPVKDIEVINLELVLADLQTATKRKNSLGKEAKAGKKEAIIEMGLLERLVSALEAGKLASTVNVNEFEAPFLKQLCLITAKPFLYVLNKKNGAKNLDEPVNRGGPTSVGPTSMDPRWDRLMDFFKEAKSEHVIVDAGVEQEMKDLDELEKMEMRSMLIGSSNQNSGNADGLNTAEKVSDVQAGVGTHDSGVNELIKKGYELLGLITYFTTGEDETRAWTIKAAGQHRKPAQPFTAISRINFVRAEVIEWNKLLEAGSYAAAREKGLVRTEGKEYVVKDGDVIEFKI
jgi:ribosome-binding ATPase YchF (GTP1/OBG family)